MFVNRSSRRYFPLQWNPSIGTLCPAWLSTRYSRTCCPSPGWRRRPPANTGGPLYTIRYFGTACRSTFRLPETRTPMSSPKWNTLIRILWLWYAISALRSIRAVLNALNWRRPLLERCSTINCWKTLTLNSAIVK